jgi:hypothetical protein
MAEATDDAAMSPAQTQTVKHVPCAMVCFLNPHRLERPDSPDWGVDLIEFRKPVFASLFETGRISLRHALKHGSARECQTDSRAMAG